MSLSDTNALVALDGSSVTVFLSTDGKLVGSASSAPSHSTRKQKSTTESVRATLISTMQEGMKEAVHRAATDAHIAGTHSIESVRVLYGAPWLHSELYEVTVTNEKAKKYKEKEVTDAIEEARMKHVYSLEKASKSYQLSCVAASTARLFENGYSVRKPVGGVLQEIKATTFAHYMSTEDKQAIESSLSKLFPKAKIVHGSLSSALISRITLPDEIKDASVFVIAADVTEVVMVLDDRIEATVSIPAGYGLIIDKLVQALPVVDDPYTYFTHYIHGELSQKESQKVLKLLDEVVTVWATQLGTTLRQAGIQTLPAEVAIAPAPRVSALYGALIGHKTSIAELFTGTAPHIQTFPHTDLLTEENSEVF